MKLPLLALGVAAMAIAVVAAAGPVHRFGAALPTAFSVLRAGEYIGTVAAVLALAGLILAYRRGARVAATIAAVALVVALASIVVPYTWLRRAETAPPIHDVTTDLENPPAFEAVVALRGDTDNPLDRPPALAQLQRDGYPDLMPLTLSVPREQAFDRALAAAQAAGWEIVTADKSSGRIEATDTTGWFGFTDDVVVRLTPWGAGTRLDVRSASRAGRSDMGRNADRIEDFLAELE